MTVNHAKHVCHQVTYCRGMLKVSRPISVWRRLFDALGLGLSLKGSGLGLSLGLKACGLGLGLEGSGPGRKKH